MAPRLPLPDDATAGPVLAAEYAAAREREGSVMAILRAMGPRAEVVRAFLALSEAALYGPAALGRRERARHGARRVRPTTDARAPRGGRRRLRSARAPVRRRGPRRDQRRRPAQLRQPRRPGHRNHADRRSRPGIGWVA